MGKADIDVFLMEDAEQVTIKLESTSWFGESSLLTHGSDSHVFGEVHPPFAHCNDLDGFHQLGDVADPRGCESQYRVVEIRNEIKPEETHSLLHLSHS